MKHLAMAVAVIVLAVVAAEQVEASPLLDAVRSLAENVLGSGQITSLAVAGDSQILIRWQSSTYKPDNKLVTTRELIYAEAQLATGSIMGRLYQITRVRFTIQKGNQMLATGENWRGRGVTVAFAPQLGGGVYKPPVPQIEPNKNPGGEASKEF